MARMEAGRADPALTQIRLSTLQGLHERVTHLTLGQTRRLLGGTVAPAGACSSHRNPRRGREGGKEVSEALYIWKNSELLTGPTRPLCQLGMGEGLVTEGGSEGVVTWQKLHREGSVVSLQN